MSTNSAKISNFRKINKNQYYQQGLTEKKHNLGGDHQNRKLFMKKKNVLSVNAFSYDALYVCGFCITFCISPVHDFFSVGKIYTNLCKALML